MKRFFALIFAVLMCFSVVSCSANGSNVDIEGAVLEGHEGVAFNKLMRKACLNFQEYLLEENEDEDGTITVKYRFTNGWKTDKLKASDYLNSKKAAITCSIVIKAKSKENSGTVTMDFYLVHDAKSNTLTVVGALYSATANGGDQTQSSFYKEDEAKDALDSFLDEYYYDFD